MMLTQKKLVYFLIFLGLAVYFNSLFNGFVWDDEEQILNNTLIHSISNFGQFFSSSTFNSGGAGNMGGLYYKPLMSVFFSLIYSLFGASAFWFHLFQVLIHIGNSILVFLIFKHLLNIPSNKNYTFISFILAVIFLIHPINSEAVVYISDLQDILFFFFGSLLLYLLTRFDRMTLKRFFLLTILGLSSLLSKETGAVLLGLGFIYLLLIKKQFIKVYFLSLVLIISVYSYLRFYLAGIFFNTHGLSPITIMSFEERLLSIPKIIFSYLKNFVFPQNLAINQHWVVKSINLPDFIIPLIGEGILILLVLVILGRLYKTHSVYTKSYLFFLIWFIVGLGFHLHIFPLDLTVSDRWFYLPIVGLLGMMGIVFSTINFSKKWTNIFLIVAVMVITGLSIRTIIRNLNWKDGLTLYSHDIRYSQDSFDLENNLGVELFRAERFEEATIHFQKSTQLAPKWWTNWNNLGVIAEKNQDFNKAAEYYQKAIDNGSYYLAYENQAKLLFFHKDPKVAKNFTEESINKFPQNGVLWFVLSLSEYKLGNINASLEASKKAYLLSPNDQTYYLYSRLSQNLPLDLTE